MKIRKIKKSDLTACSKILENAYSKPPYQEKFKKGNSEKYITEKYNNYKNHSFVVTNDKNQLIAFMFLNISAWSDGPQAVLEEIVVDPKIQNSGIGTNLMAHAEKYLKSLNAKSSVLWVKNDKRLLNFYKKQGYFLAEDYVVMFKNF